VSDNREELGMKNAKYEVEYYRAEAGRGNTYVDIYSAPNREAVLKQWFVDHPGCSRDCVVRIEEVEEEEH